MTFQSLNYGVTNDDPSADTVRAAGIKIDDNFRELYSVQPGGSPIVGVQNKVWATGNGADTEAGFRSLVNADIPTTLSGKTLTSTTLNSPTITTPTITGGTMTGGTITGATITTPTVTGGTITGATFVNPLGLLPGKVLLWNQTPTAGTTTHTITGITGYDTYELEIFLVYPTSSTVLMQYSADGGSTYPSFNILRRYILNSGAATETTVNNTAGTEAAWFTATAGSTAMTTIRIFNMNSSTYYKSATVNCVSETATAPNFHQVGQSVGTTTAMNAIRLTTTGGFTGVGYVKLYGVI